MKTEKKFQFEKKKIYIYITDMKACSWETHLWAHFCSM